MVRADFGNFASHHDVQPDWQLPTAAQCAPVWATSTEVLHALCSLPRRNPRFAMPHLACRNALPCIFIRPASCCSATPAGRTRAVHAGVGPGRAAPRCAPVLCGATYLSGATHVE